MLSVMLVHILVYKSSIKKRYTETVCRSSILKTAYRKGIQKQHTIMTHRCHLCSDKIAKTDESGELDMVWHETYPAHCQPDMKHPEFVDSPYWEQLCSYLQKDIRHIAQY